MSSRKCAGPAASRRGAAGGRRGRRSRCYHGRDRQDHLRLSSSATAHSPTSRACTAVPGQRMHLGERPGDPRHSLSWRSCSRKAISSASTQGPPSTAGTATTPPRLPCGEVAAEAQRADGRHQEALLTGHRGCCSRATGWATSAAAVQQYVEAQAFPSCAAMWVTAWAGSCTKTRRCPTSARPGHGAAACDRDGHCHRTDGERGTHVVKSCRTDGRS